MKGKQPGKGAHRAKLEFAEHSSSDHKMMMNAYNSWRNTLNQKKFETENCIHHQKMQMMHDVRGSIMRYLVKAKYIDNPDQYNGNSLKWEVVKICLTAGLYRKPKNYYFSSL